jgi:hypothetical protein
MRRPFLVLALLLVAPLATAQVYKWTDAQGTTHYSESPPPVGTKYSQVNVSTDTSSPAASDNASPAASSSSASTNGSSQDGSTSQPDTPENRAKLCASLSANIKTLQNSGPVVMTGSNGQQQLLNSDSRKQQLDASQSQFNQYCSDQ